MSSTLVPPSYYEVGDNGKRPQPYRTIVEAAWAVVHRPSTAAVTAVTGDRRRSLTDVELRELGQHVRAWRLLAERAERQGDRTRAVKLNAGTIV